MGYSKKSEFSAVFGTHLGQPRRTKLWAVHFMQMVLRQGRDSCTTASAADTFWSSTSRRLCYWVCPSWGKWSWPDIVDARVRIISAYYRKVLLTQAACHAWDLWWVLYLPLSQHSCSPSTRDNQLSATRHLRSFHQTSTQQQTQLKPVDQP